MAGQTAVLKRTNSVRDTLERYISKDRHNAHLRIGQSEKVTHVTTPFRSRETCSATEINAS